MHTFIDTWKERNPNLELIGAYYHADEDGEPHVHIDYVPVAHGYKKGLETQTGLVKALGEQGFEKFGKDTAQIKWEKRENDYLTTICETVGLKVAHPKIDGREHLETQVLKLQKRVEELEQAERASEAAEKRLEQLEGRVMEQAEINALNGKRSLTGGLKGISYTEYLSLKKTAEKVNTVELRERNLTEREQKITVREEHILAEESNMAQKRSEMAFTVHESESRVQDLSERERVLNERIVALEEEYQSKIKIIETKKERYYIVEITDHDEANAMIAKKKNKEVIF